MKIELVDFSVHKFSVPKVETAKEEITERKTLYLKFKNEYGHTVIGEASPLDNFSLENFDETRKKVESILSGKSNSISSLKINDFKEFENLLNEKFANFPTLIFAYEQAFIKLAINSAALQGDETIDFIRLRLNKCSQRCVKSALLTSTDKAEFLTNHSRDNNSYTIKIKITDKIGLSVIQEISNQNNIKIRLDPNGIWKYDEATENIKLIKHLNIDFIEDPTSQLEDNIRLANEFPNLVAIDLTAKQIEEFYYALKNGVKIFVIKPMFFGGIGKMLDFIEEARNKKARVIISTTFENAIAFNWIKLFASFVPSETHGLGIRINTKSSINDILCFKTKDVITDVLH